MTVPNGRYGLAQAARMEWIKLRSLRSTWLTLAIAVAASAGIALAIGSSSTTNGGMFVGNTLVEPADRVPVPTTLLPSLIVCIASAPTPSTISLEGVVEIVCAVPVTLHAISFGVTGGA